MLFEECERLKIRFLAAFDGLRERGLLSEEEWDELTQLLDEMDDLTSDELAARLQGFRERVEARAALTPSPGEGAS